MNNDFGLYTPNKIRTFSGEFIDVFDPKPEQIKIVDIAHALSQMPRFGGHLPYFYSVAEHSLCCANMSTDKNRLAALLHDASEAYLMDIPSPTKNRLPDYQKAENNLQRVIAERFGLQFPFNAEIKVTDKAALEYEYMNIMIDEKGSAMPMTVIKRIFLDKFDQYGGK